ncbi:ElaB/YqjD/DUF883 family membrane-anchored ribosome-binding protein [Lysobacter enzymogenes]|uniref:hypothetical protein n=1 Tax=Lysobacter enzymogenes TaxID=69 RepID=UPI003392CDEA
MSTTYAPASTYDLEAAGSRLSWGAVLAGLVVALVSYLALGTLGTAIGAATIDPLQEHNPLAGLGTATLIWAAVSSLIAVAAGAFVAGRLAARAGAVHGFLTWAVTTVCTVLVIGNIAGSLVGTGARIVGQGVQVAGTVAGAGIGATAYSADKQGDGTKLDLSELEAKARELLSSTGKPELQPEALKRDANAAADQLKAEAKQAAQAPSTAPQSLDQWLAQIKDKAAPALNAADRDALVNVIANQTGKPRDEAAQIADQYIALYQDGVRKYEEAKRQAEAKAREVADATAKAVSRAAWVSLIAMILGALLASFVGGLGQRSYARAYPRSKPAA